MGAEWSALNMRLVLLLTIAAASPLPAQTGIPQPVPASIEINPKARQLFESDWVLMDWGLRQFDRDRDARLSDAEATAGAAAFKDMADANDDGKVTPHEFRQARAFLLARY